MLEPSVLLDCRCVVIFKTDYRFIRVPLAQEVYIVYWEFRRIKVDHLWVKQVEQGQWKICLCYRKGHITVQFEVLEHHVLYGNFWKRLVNLLEAKQFPIVREHVHFRLVAERNRFWDRIINIFSRWKYASVNLKLSLRQRSRRQTTSLLFEAKKDTITTKRHENRALYQFNLHRESMHLPPPSPPSLQQSVSSSFPPRSFFCLRVVWDLRAQLS